MDGNTDNKPAQVLRIVWKSKDAWYVDPDTYFTAHENFTTADIVLESCVHLLSIDREKATFLQVDEDCNLFNSRQYPIAFMAQTQLAKKVIILPIRYFNKIVDEIDISNRKVVWMFHTERCGSTAWVQAFNSLSGWTVFSELQTVRHTCIFGDNNHSSIQGFSKTAEYRRYMTAIIKMSVRHVPPGEAVFWKASSYEEYLIDIISTSFPKHKMLITFRDIAPTIQSYHTTYASAADMKYSLSRLSADPFTKDPSLKQTRDAVTNGYDFEFCKDLIIKVKPQTVVEWMTLMWAAKMFILMQHVNSGKNIKSIKYNQLKECKRAAVIKVFRYLDIGLENIEGACEALNTDSQKGTWLSQESRAERKAEEWRRTESEVNNCNMILDAFGLPDIDSKIDLSVEL